jgi:hypothetical protein
MAEHAQSLANASCGATIPEIEDGLIPVRPVQNKQRWWVIVSVVALVCLLPAAAFINHQHQSGGRNSSTITHNKAAFIAQPTALGLRQQEKQSKTVVSSWQPNDNFNGQQESKLTDFERSARDTGIGERKVTLRKPLGLVLDAKSNGDVYVKEVVKGGNGDMNDVKVGDIVTMTSATFGGDMWSTRGVGLERVMRSIEVRAGPTVSLALQNKAEQKNFLSGLFKDQDKIREERIDEAARKRDTLEAEVQAERDEAAKGWFGLR